MLGEPPLPRSLETENRGDTVAQHAERVQGVDPQDSPGAGGQGGEEGRKEDASRGEEGHPDGASKQAAEPPHEDPHAESNATMAGSGSADTTADSSRPTGTAEVDAKQAPASDTNNATDSTAAASVANVATGGFQEWFNSVAQAEESGALGQIACPEGDEAKLCEATFKFLRKLKVRVFQDISCHRNRNWIPVVLTKITKEVSPFKYICVDNEPEKVEEAKQAHTALSDGIVEYQVKTWWNKDSIEPAEPQFPKLVMAFDLLSGLSFGRVYNFFASCKRANVDGVLIDNYPSVSNDPGRGRRYLNVKRHPFKFGQTDVVQNITFDPSAPERQLLLYNKTTLPDSLR
mmetsp:Transcript_43777/g.107471  ORF Transcript_43777/g.107471 Transcript_43777/m.107471 type:complete len:346 (+) Transcript_43777:1-1038(+)